MSGAKGAAKTREAKTKKEWKAKCSSKSLFFSPSLRAKCENRCKKYKIKCVEGRETAVEEGEGEIKECAPPTQTLTFGATRETCCLCINF
jgi:hypothetical protein